MYYFHHKGTDLLQMHFVHIFLKMVVESYLDEFFLHVLPNGILQKDM